MIEEIQTAVREKYGDTAKAVTTTGCCGPTAYGCGNPNCVINLSADKDDVLREAFRVLKVRARKPAATTCCGSDCCV